MSISKYIEEFNANIEKTIQKRIKKAEENPYPTEEIIQLREQDPDSAIAKMFDENGEVLAPLFNTELMAAAIEEDRDLYRRLRRGDRAKKGLKNNEYLESLDAEEHLNNNYSKLVSKVSEVNSLGGKLDIEEILTSSEDDFLDAAYAGLDLDMSYVSDATIQAALLEKYQSNPSPEPEETEETVQPLIEEDETSTEELVEGSSPINLAEDEILEETEDPSILETNPELEEESDLPINVAESPEINLDQEAPATPINEVGENVNIVNNQEDVTNNLFTSEELSSLQEISNNATSINPESVEINQTSSEIVNESSPSMEYNSFFDSEELALLDAILPTSSNTVSNQINNQTDTVLVSENTEVSNIESSQSEVSAINENAESANAAEYNAFFDSDELAMLDVMLGNPTTQSQQNVETTPIEVSKVNTMIDRSIAPINNTSVNSSSQSNQSNTSQSNTSESVSSNDMSQSSESMSSNNSSSSNTNTVSGDNVSNNSDNTLNESIQTITQPVDVSTLESRLKKIETLLMGPLDVKIIE